MSELRRDSNLRQTPFVPPSGEGKVNGGFALLKGRNGENSAEPLQEQLNKAVWEKRAAAEKPEDAEPAKDPGGRPRVLHDRLKGKVVAYVELGLSVQQAAAMIGCSLSTIIRETGRDDTFRDDMLLAKQRSRVRPLLTILQSCNRSWRAAAWLLKNHNPDAEATPGEIEDLLRTLEAEREVLDKETERQRRESRDPSSVSTEPPGGHGGCL